MSSHWHPRAMVAALASACLVFHWVLVVLFRSHLDRDLTEIEIQTRAGWVGSAHAKGQPEAKAREDMTTDSSQSKVTLHQLKIFHYFRRENSASFFFTCGKRL